MKPEAVRQMKTDALRWGSGRAVCTLCEVDGTPAKFLARHSSFDNVGSDRSHAGKEPAHLRRHLWKNGGNQRDYRRKVVGM